VTTIWNGAGPLSEREHGRQLRHAIYAGTVGTIIEAYDFLLYVQIAPLVFARLFFPSSDPLVGTLQAFGIYAVGFVSRPVGAMRFGHYGDRIGRKAARRLGAVRRLDTASGLSLRPHRPQADVSDRDHDGRGFRLHLLGDDEHWPAGPDRSCDHPVLHPARHDVRPAGGADRRTIRAAVRYSGSSLGFHPSPVVAGAPAPLIATALFAALGSGYAIALYILFCAMVSAAATILLPDYTNATSRTRISTLDCNPACRG
jgi:hypothetical protein